MLGASKAISQSDRVVLALRELLLTGEFPAGRRLTELDLAARLGASRTPVRHALVRLAHEGLLDVLPSGGFSVRAFTLDEIWDAIEIRGVLEGTAARLSAERLTHPSELDPLTRITDATVALVPMDIRNFVRYLELNEAFHFELRRLAKSAMLLRTIDVVLTLPFAAPGALVFSAAEPAAADVTTAIAIEHHQAIIDAIRRREGTRAEAVAREHARLARRNLERALQDQELFRQVPGAALIKISAAS